MLLMQIRLTQTEFILYGILLGVVLGFLLGLIPLFLGIKKHNRKYGVWGLVISTFTGAITVIISVVVVGIFSWLILKNAKQANTSDSVDSNQSLDSNSKVS